MGFQQHPTALVESETIGDGTRIWAFAHVLAGAVIGRDCNIGDHCYIAGNAMIAGGTTVEPHCFIGVNAALGHEITIGRETFIGAGTLITKDVEPKSVYVAEDTARYRLDSSSFLRLTKMR